MIEKMQQTRKTADAHQHLNGGTLNKGGARPNAGRKKLSVKRQSTRSLPETPVTQVAIAAGVALSESALDDGRRLARRMMNGQKRASVKEMTEFGIAPLDILMATMHRLFNMSLDAREAGGLLITKVTATRSATSKRALRAFGELSSPVIYTELTLLLACAEVAGKAAQYVHPKLVAVDTSVTHNTLEDHLLRLAAKVKGKGEERAAAECVPE